MKRPTIKISPPTEEDKLGDAIMETILEHDLEFLREWHKEQWRIIIENLQVVT